MHIAPATDPSSQEPASSAGCGGTCGCGGHATSVDVLDVRLIPHSVRRAAVLAAVGAVPQESSLVLLAPHDPSPIIDLVTSTYPDEFGWEYDASGPETWAVRVTRR